MTQLARGHFVVLAVAYPPNTTFHVYLESDPVYGLLANSSDPSKGYKQWPCPNKTLSAVLTPTENLKPYDDPTFICPGGWSWCDFASSGGIGPAWNFDGKYLRIRVVGLNFYNSFEGKLASYGDYYYREGGIWVPKIVLGFRYVVKASCADCKVQGTHQGVKYFDVPDVPPAERFPTQWGGKRPMPTYVDARETAKFTAPQCAV